ncbi:MAG: ABC transporter substrate-binding protein [Pseudomonadota bacterium]
MKRITLALGATLALAAAPAAANDAIKIGYITTLTTPAAVIGQDMKAAVELSLDHIGGKIAGKPVEILFEDDGFKPNIGRAKAEKLVRQENVDVVAGFIWSHVLLASAKTVLQSGKFLISTNAGPSALAGKRCHENFFATRGQNDMLPMALGEVMNADGIKSLYILAPNYAAGKDVAKGVERTFKGKIAGRDFTKWGADAQLDFSAELAKAKASGADALFVFYPGRASAAIVNQLKQAETLSNMKLYSVYTIDGLSLPRFQKAGLDLVLGSRLADYWSPDLATPENKKFVEGFVAKTGRLPSNYAAAAYDLLPYLKAAIEQAGGDVSKSDAVREALRKANYKSVRGSYKLAKNHFPIDNYYALKADAVDGRWTKVLGDKVMGGRADPYTETCAMGK